jgi:hypothetical protein
MALEDVGDGYSYDTETGEFVKTPVDNTGTIDYTSPPTGTDNTGTDGSGFNFGNIGKILSGTSSYGSLGQLAGLAGIGTLLNKIMGGSSSGTGYTGYQGGIPTLTASRQQLPIPTTMQDASGKTVPRRPGSGGVTYFTPMQYLKPGETAAAPQPTYNPDTPVYNSKTPVYVDKPEPMYTAFNQPAQNTSPVDIAMAGGGITSLGGYSDGGQLLRGPGDGVSDSIPASIGDRQPARLADGEFVVPARIVSELGNGSTEAGARKLYAMMDRIKATRAKAKNIAADTKAYKHLPA